ncbi:MAG TPA: hypothetical protein PLH53_16045, partial [Ignavibacteriaceae bacterium]|nr:hypothetical protein [Ignavibacteriaceae bacterium]
MYGSISRSIPLGMMGNFTTHKLNNTKKTKLQRTDRSPFSTIRFFGSIKIKKIYSPKFYYKIIILRIN